MHLIAESGSTKTQWGIIDKGSLVHQFSTIGINPMVISDTLLQDTIEEVRTAIYSWDIDAVDFYGAGCAPDQEGPSLQKYIADTLKVEKVTVQSDLIASCIAVLGKEKGMAAILGTGSNICMYENGKVVIDGVSLGYLLGDEGSGNHLGKKLILAYSYKQLPLEVSQKVELFHPEILSPDFIRNIYQMPLLNRFLASYAKTMLQLSDYDCIKRLIEESFDAFIDCHIQPMATASGMNTVNFTGSIAFYFSEILSTQLSKKGYQLGKVIAAPFDGLVNYYCSNDYTR